MAKKGGRKQQKKKTTGGKTSRTKTVKQGARKGTPKKPPKGAEFETLAIGDLRAKGAPAIDFVIATATKRERRTMLDRMQPLGGRSRIVKTSWEESTYYLGVCGLYTCALVMSEPGSGGRAGSGQHIADAIERWAPRGAIMPGIAFGRGGDDQMLGDVLISTRAIPYDHVRRGTTREIFRSPHPEAGQTLLDRARNLHWTWTPSHAGAEPRDPILGAVLSGDSLVDDPQFKAHLFEEFPEAVGGEMELSGLYAAAERRRVEWILIKGICDWGEDKRAISDQPLAARNACDCTAALLADPGLGPENFVRGGVASAGSAESRAIVNARQFALSTAVQAVRAAQRDHRAACDELGALLAPLASSVGKTLSPPQVRQAALLEAKVGATAEQMLNAYNDAAARFIAAAFPEPEFHDTLGNELCELVEEAELDEQGAIGKALLPRGGSAFASIWEAHDRLRPIFRPLALQEAPPTGRVEPFLIEPSWLGRADPVPIMTSGAFTGVRIQNHGTATAHACSATALLDDGREVPLPWVGSPDINRGETREVTLCTLALDDRRQRILVLGPELAVGQGPTGSLKIGAIVHPAPDIVRLTLRITSRDTPPHRFRWGLHLAAPASAQT